MQLRTFIKKLQKIEAEGHGRALVKIDKKSFNHPLEPDGCNILDVTEIDWSYIEQLDGDGFTATTKNGQTKVKKCIILTGN
ncbi:MAG: hypothetical protein KDD61_06640 [Bdellovibrionales bacterium]|nr:hypothetical protein [Bdellovibrionales bacterium]